MEKSLQNTRLRIATIANIFARWISLATNTTSEESQSCGSALNAENKKETDDVLLLWQF